MKLYTQINLLTVIVLFLSINNATSVAKQGKNKIDEIIHHTNEIDLKKDKYKSDSTEIMNESTEGGVLISYNDGKYLVKMESYFYGETGQATEIYYFSNHKLIYFSYAYVKYKELLITNKYEIENQFKVIYYIDNNHIIKKEYSDESIANKYGYKSKSYNQIRNDIDNYIDIIKRK